MKTLTATLLLENLFDSLPEGDIKTLSDHLFSPKVKVVEEDCSPILGEKVLVNSDALGLVTTLDTVVTPQVLLDTTIAGQQYLRVRSTGTCLSSGGVCLNCLLASRAWLKNTVDVGDETTLDSVFLMQVQQITQEGTEVVFELDFSEEEYDYAVVVVNGVVLTPSAQYSIEGSTLTLSEVPDRIVLNTTTLETAQVSVRYYTESKSPFLYWLAGTYSGSLLGIEELQHPRLPTKMILMDSLVSPDKLEILGELITANGNIGTTAKQYFQSLPVGLEKGLLATALLALI